MLQPGAIEFFRNQRLKVFVGTQHVIEYRIFRREKIIPFSIKTLSSKTYNQPIIATSAANIVHNCQLRWRITIPMLQLLFPQARRGRPYSVRSKIGKFYLKLPPTIYFKMTTFKLDRKIDHFQTLNLNHHQASGEKHWAHFHRILRRWYSDGGPLGPGRRVKKLTIAV